MRSVQWVVCGWALAAVSCGGEGDDCDAGGQRDGCLHDMEENHPYRTLPGAIDLLCGDNPFVADTAMPTPDRRNCEHDGRTFVELRVGDLDAGANYFYEGGTLVAYAQDTDPTGCCTPVWFGEIELDCKPLNGFTSACD